MPPRRPKRNNKRKNKRFGAKRRPLKRKNVKPRWKRRRAAGIDGGNQILVKAHKFVGLDNISLFGTAPAGGEQYDPKEWYFFQPLNLNRVGNSGPSDVNRQSNVSYIRNVNFNCQVNPSKRYIEPFQIRFAYGYYKGDDNAGTQALSTTGLKTIYPETHTFLNTKQNPATEDFKWKWNKTYTFVPKQIYDEDTEEGDHNGADRVLVALWTPTTVKINWKMNRRHTWEDADGDSLNGWMPIIALQCKPNEGGTAFTRPTLPSQADTGIAPGPRFHINLTTYFNDIY